MKPGLKGLLEFCTILKSRKIAYSLHHYSPDALTVFFTIVGARVEVQFFEDRFDFSVFTGDESVLDDQDALFRIIDAHQ